MATKNICGSQNCITQKTAIFLFFFSLILLYLLNTIHYDFLSIYITLQHIFTSTLINFFFDHINNLFRDMHSSGKCVGAYVDVWCTRPENMFFFLQFVFLFSHVKLLYSILNTHQWFEFVKYISLFFCLHFVPLLP